MGTHLCNCANELEPTPFESKKKNDDTQAIYECVTCWGYGSDFRLCNTCAHKHHTIHNLSQDKSGRRFTRCVCCYTQHVVNLCSKEIVFQAKQHMYQCKDCLKPNDINNTGICLVCVKNCHLGHRTKPIKIVDNLKCCCGQMGVCAIRCKCSED